VAQDEQLGDVSAPEAAVVRLIELVLLAVDLLVVARDRNLLMRYGVSLTVRHLQI